MNLLSVFPHSLFHNHLKHPYNNPTDGRTTINWIGQDFLVAYLGC